MDGVCNKYNVMEYAKILRVEIQGNVRWKAIDSIEFYLFVMTDRPTVLDCQNVNALIVCTRPACQPVSVSF